ncbi:molybdopterin converting factor subunit 1 [Halalkalibacter nanhaiisediminis]|uniref:Molybdopterin synthase sulfur carrier subunit n=1 Tax=Halalkalibacter nanhaiisediminis TaxID=688079 RepID=A0A562QR11_9BACI|nr:molybdopterin converting factor subunit 1 [Halalkalibacter nanhaiisediminis]TWI59147.1 molybdopterin synthase sulfur carrier subunit [Halalkalibacter nanhaiisediminis]
MIKILLFAELQEQAGVDQLEAEKAGITVSELKSWLQDAYKLTALSNAMPAINENYADDQDVLKDGDVIAFIPPVSGG